MQPTTTRRRVLARSIGTVLGIGLAVLVTGCGAGQITQTDTQQSGVNGANANAGPIALRDVQLAAPAGQQGTYPPGSNAVLIATIVNTGLTSDSLVKVTTPAAASVTIDGSAAGGAQLPGNFAVASGQDPDDATSIVPGTPAPALASTSASSPSSVTPPSGSTSPSASTGPASSAVVPVTPGKVTIVLTGMKSVNGGPLRAGMTIPITFYFGKAGQVTIDNVPIGAPPDGTAVLNPSNG